MDKTILDCIQAIALALGFLSDPVSLMPTIPVAQAANRKEAAV